MSWLAHAFELWSDRLIDRSSLLSAAAAEVEAVVEVVAVAVGVAVAAFAASVIVVAEFDAGAVADAEPM